MKFCSHCGKELLDDAVMCPGCGCMVAVTTSPPDLANYTNKLMDSHRRIVNEIAYESDLFLRLKTMFIIFLSVPLSIVVLMISRGWTDGWEASAILFCVIASIALLLFARESLNNIRSLRKQDEVSFYQLNNTELLTPIEIKYNLLTKNDVIPIIIPSITVCISHFLAEWLYTMLELDNTSRIEEVFTLIGFLIGIAIALLIITIRNKKQNSK